MVRARLRQCATGARARARARASSWSWYYSIYIRVYTHAHRARTTRGTGRPPGTDARLIARESARASETVHGATVDDERRERCAAIEHDDDDGCARARVRGDVCDE